MNVKENTELKNSNFTKDEIKYLFVAILDNFSGSVGWWYFLFTLLLIFTLKSVEPYQLSLLTLNGYPSAFKFLFAPIVDTYYSERFGKRKTYLVGVSYIQFFLFFGTSFWINDLVENNAIGVLVFLGLIQNTVSLFKYNADFGFMVTHFRPHMQAKAQGISRIGIVFAALIS